MKKEELLILARSMLDSPEKVFEMLVDDLDKCQQIRSGLNKVIANWDQVEDNPANLTKQLQTSVKCLNRSINMNQRMLLVMMIYVSGGDFHVDAAKLMNRLGAGQEALQAMMNRKMRGKS